VRPGALGWPRGSTVRGAHTAHAHPARSHAPLPVRLIELAAAHLKTAYSARLATVSFSVRLRVVVRCADHVTGGGGGLALTLSVAERG
jgi:hypothetical protein